MPVPDMVHLLHYRAPGAWCTCLLTACQLYACRMLAGGGGRHLRAIPARYHMPRGNARRFSCLDGVCCSVPAWLVSSSPAMALPEGCCNPQHNCCPAPCRPTAAHARAGGCRHVAAAPGCHSGLPDHDRAAVGGCAVSQLGGTHTPAAACLPCRSDGVKSVAILSTNP